MSDTKSTFNITNILLGIFSILVISLFLFHWNSVNKNINELKKDYEGKFDRISKVKTNLIDVDKLSHKDSNITINKNDLVEINKNINLLAEEIFNERNRAETLIDKDIDRLNLYMAIGIGFMALIGIFLPILVNLISIQELRENQKDLKNQIEKIDQSKIEEAQKGIEKIESDLDKYLPSISTLYIQNSLNRYFNISPILLTNLIREKDKTYYIEILENIRIGFSKCKEDSRHKIKNDTFFISTLQDFVYFLEKPSHHSSFFNKDIQNGYDNLRKHILIFVSGDKEDENSFYSGVDEKLVLLINLIKSKSA